MDNHTDGKKMMREVAEVAFRAGVVYGLKASLQIQDDVKAGKTFGEVDAMTIAAEEEALETLFAKLEI